VADGAYYGYQILDNRAVSVYYPNTGAILADKFAGARHEDQTYQRVAINFMFPEVTPDGYSPNFYLNLNWTGGSLFSNCYRIGLRGLKDFNLMKMADDDKEEISSGWLAYPDGPLSAKTTYRVTLERNGNRLTGTIRGTDGTLLGTAHITDTGVPLNGGHATLTTNGSAGAEIQSIEWDNFEYELSNLEEVTASAVGSDGPTLDGVLNDACWQAAAVSGGFYRTDGTGKAEMSARAQIAYDQEILYVALRCPLRDAEAVKAAKSLTPDQMFVGNTMEVFLDPFMEHRRPAGLTIDLDELFYHHGGAKIFRFAVNAANGQYSELMGLPWYKVPWESATHVGQDSWSAELAIPFTSLSYFDQIAGGVVPAWTDQWGINFACDQTAWVPQFSLDGYPLAFGSLNNVKVDPDPFKWLYLTGVAPGVVGNVPLAFTINDTRGSKGNVKVIASEIPYGNRGSFTPFKTQEAVGQRSKIFGCIRFDMNLPIASPGDHLVQLSVVDADSGRLLANRPVLVEDVRVGSGVFDRSIYLDEPVARLTISIDTQVMPGSFLPCHLRRAGRKSVLFGKKFKLREDNTATIDFDLNLLPVGQYSVTVTVPGYEDYPLTETFRKLPPQPGTVQYTDRGVILRDGKPFFPLGMYYVMGSMTDEFMKEYAAAGFNTFLLEWGNADSFVTTTRRVARHGLVPILSIQNMDEQRSACANATDYTRRTMLEGRFPTARQAIKMIAAQAGRNVLAWYTRDEPNEDMVDLVKGLHDIANEEDPYRPSMTVIFTPHLFPTYRDACDILGPDIYRRGAEVGDAMARAVADMQGKPVFAVLQTFYDPGGKMPTRAELRNMTFLSIVRGVTGVLYFAYQYGGPPMAERDPETWRDLKELVGQLRDLTPVILSDPTSQEQLKIRGEGAESVVARVYDHEDAYVIIAVNQENKPIKEIELKLEMMQSTSSRIQMGSAEVLYENRRVALSGRSWKDDFASYAVHLYRIMKAGKNIAILTKDQP
jgi:hypothetical protein